MPDLAVTESLAHCGDRLHLPFGFGRPLEPVIQWHTSFIRFEGLIPGPPPPPPPLLTFIRSRPPPPPGPGSGVHRPQPRHRFGRGPAWSRTFHEDTTGQMLGAAADQSCVAPGEPPPNFTVTDVGAAIVTRGANRPPHHPQKGTPSPSSPTPKTSTNTQVTQRDTALDTGCTTR